VAWRGGAGPDGVGLGFKKIHLVNGVGLGFEGRVAGWVQA